MKRKLLFFIVALLPLVANAYDAKIDGIYYNFYGDEAEVTYMRADTTYYDEYSYSINYIPAYYNTISLPESVSYNGQTYRVTSIGYSAFYNCSSLTSITIPNSVTSIGSYAFTNCRHLASITIPNSVTSIGTSAFSCCWDLTSVTIPNSVTYIVYDAFNETGWSKAQPDGILYLDDWLLGYKGTKPTGNVTINSGTRGIASSAFVGCNGLTSITIPNSVTTIGNNTFRGCSGLTSVTIPNSVTSIGEHTFYGCTSLTSITIPNSVTSIDLEAFAFCSGLTSITIPTSVTSIGSLAFWHCSGLTAVIIPNSVTSIGYSAFGDCTGLTSITIPNSVTSIDNSTFRGCSSLTSVTIGNGVTSIGTLAFENCTGLTSITIPNSVTSIGSSAFKDCSVLTSVTIGNSVTSIGNSAFRGCSSLTDVWCYAESVPSTVSNVFSNSSISSATLHVPGKSLALYKAASPWNRFEKIISIDNIYTLTYIVDGDVYKTYEVEYNSPITPEPEPTKEGYTFSGWSEIPDIMPEEDVVINGTFSINSYTITYLVDGNVYKTETIAYGTKLTLEPAPVKEGYTFSGWSYIPSTMPATDVVVMGTFSINSYTLTYKVDGEVYKTSSVVYGTEIVPEEEPSKEGYAFSGWSEIPELMPDNDVEVTGTFSINSYTLTYMVDGEDYKTSTVVYGTALTPEAEPTKEGYTFSGWDKVPATMPAHDVTVTGSFTINKYKLTYMVDGAVYRSYEINYASTITPEAEPTKEGHTFSGWDDVPETMPAHDVVVTGSFSINSYFLFYVLDGGIYKAYSIKYGTVIVPETEPDKEGYLFSGWSEIPATMPDHDVVVHGNFYLYGDVNGDDKVDLSDAIMVTYYSLHQIPAKFNEAVADMNDDGEIDLSDAIIIIYKSLGVIL